MLKLYGSVKCAESMHVKSLLEEENIPFVFIDIDDNQNEFLKLKEKYEDKAEFGIPLFEYSDGTVSKNFFLALVDR